MRLSFSQGLETTEDISGERKVQEKCERKTSVSSETHRHLLPNEIKGEVGFLCTFNTRAWIPARLAPDDQK